MRSEHQHDSSLSSKQSNVSYWLDQERKVHSEQFESVATLLKMILEQIDFVSLGRGLLVSLTQHYDCNNECYGNLLPMLRQSSVQCCEPASLPGLLPDMVGCSYLGLRYDSFEQAESLGLAFLVVYMFKSSFGWCLCLRFPDCVADSDDSARLLLRRFTFKHSRMPCETSSKLRDSVQQGDVRKYSRYLYGTRDYICRHNISTHAMSIGSNRLDRIGRKRLRESYKTLRHASW